MLSRLRRFLRRPAIALCGRTGAGRRQSEDPRQPPCRGVRLAARAHGGARRLPHAVLLRAGPTRSALLRGPPRPRIRCSGCRGAALVMARQKRKTSPEHPRLAINGRPLTTRQEQDWRRANDDLASGDFTRIRRAVDALRAREAALRADQTAASVRQGLSDTVTLERGRGETIEVSPAGGIPRPRSHPEPRWPRNLAKVRRHRRRPVPGRHALSRTL